MSLNWNTSKVENWEEKQKTHWNTLEFLIWESMSTGMGCITESNVDEWYYRIQRNKLEGGYKLSDITKEDIQMWVGLTTNVMTLSRREFESVLKQRYPEGHKLTKKQLEQ